MPAKKKTKKKTKKRNGVTVRRNGKTLHGAAAKAVLKKRKAANRKRTVNPQTKNRATRKQAAKKRPARKRRNAPGYSADTPIAVTQHYRSGGPGYASKRERIIRAGQRDLFAQGASMTDLLGYLRKNPTVIDAVKRKLGAEGFRTASPSLLKKTMRAVIAGARKPKSKAKRTRRNPLLPRLSGAAQKVSEWAATKTYTVTASDLQRAPKRKFKVRATTPNEALRLAKQQHGTERFDGYAVKNPGARRARPKRRNPDPGEMFELFTGQQHDEHHDVLAPAGAPRNLDELGDFVEFKWVDNEGHHFTVNLEEQSLAQTLAVHRYADGRDELFLVSGPGQPLAYFGDYLPPGNHGHITEVTYRAQKVHLGDSKPRLYYHKLGEETGQPPTLHINKDGNLIFKGGAYWIEDRGIVN